MEHQLELQSVPAPLYSRAIATDSIPPGSALLKSRPLSQIPIFVDEDPGTTIPKRCWQCLDLVSEPVVCGKCREEWYCSKDCRASAWESHHSPVCKGLPSLHYTLKTTDFTAAQSHACFLLLRVISSYFRTAEAVERLKACAGMSFEQIRDVNLTLEGAKASDSHSRLSDDLEGFLQLVPMPLQTADQKIINVLHSKFAFLARSGLTEKETEFLLMRFQANNHVLSDERLKPIGHAILPTISRYCNHACLPHGVISSSWDPENKVIEVMVKLMRPLKAGEQVTIPYIDAILPLQERQTFLQERYGFTCDCILCNFQKSVSPAVLAQAGTATPEKLSELFTTYVQKHVDDLRVTRPYSKISGFKPGDPFPERSTPLLPGRVALSKVGVDKLVCLQPDVIKELNLMFGESTADQRWDIARIQGQHILAIYGILYGWRFPLVGLHCLELAKVALNLHIQWGETPEEYMMRFNSTPAVFLQEAAIYTMWAKDNLVCSTSMNGPRSAGSNQSLAEEILEMEKRCAAEWVAQAGDAPDFV